MQIFKIGFDVKLGFCVTLEYIGKQEKTLLGKSATINFAKPLSTTIACSPYCVNAIHFLIYYACFFCAKIEIQVYPL